MSTTVTLTIGIYVYDDVEVLDFGGPYEVFTTATRMHARTYGGDAPLFRVVTIGRTPAPVKARAGLDLRPDFAIDDHPRLDCLIVPGGVVTAECGKADVIAWMAAQAAAVAIVASVCTGAFMLAQAGLPDGLRVTTHWEDIDDLRMAFPALDVQENVRWVDQGAIVTSAGISAGIDMSLHLVERLHDRTLAERTARQLDFAWTENVEALAVARN